MGATGDVMSRQDGLHNVLMTTEFQAALLTAVKASFGPLIEPEFLEELRRYVQKGRRNDSRSYAVGVEPPAAGVAGRVNILPRDESRVRAFIFNSVGGQTIFIGGRQVTVGGANDASGGIPILAGQGMWIDGTIGELWAVSSAAGQDVRVLDICGTLT